MRALPFPSIFPVLLSLLLVMKPVWAQTSTGPVDAGAIPDALRIRIVNTDALKPVSHAAEMEKLTIEVTNSSGAAVTNAAVTCRLPDSGATGTFSDGSHATVAYTDANGRANLDRFRWDNVAGSAAIRLTANKGTAHTGVLVETSVTADAGSEIKTAAVASAPATPQAIETTAVAVPMPPPQPAQNQVSGAAEPVVSGPSMSVTTPDNKKATAQPGQLAQETPVLHTAASGVSAPTTPDPTVSVTRTAAADAPHKSHVKWIVLIAVVAAAGAGAAFAMKGKSSNTTSSTSAVTIGNPSVSVGQP